MRHRRVVEAADPESILEIIGRHGCGETYFTTYRNGKSEYRNTVKMTVCGQEFKAANIGQGEPIRKAIAQVLKDVAEEEKVTVHPRSTRVSMYQVWADEKGYEDDKAVIPGLTVQFCVSSKIDLPRATNTYGWRHRNFSIDFTVNIGVEPSQWEIKKMSGSLYVGNVAKRDHVILRKFAWRMMGAMGIQESDATKWIKTMSGEKEE
jgi:hypothetical protein